ncbi:MAG: hypothetical protein Q8P10_02125 [bacterium]|nr:hypothetical protein [bacterium]
MVSESLRTFGVYTPEVNTWMDESCDFRLKHPEHGSVRVIIDRGNSGVCVFTRCEDQGDLVRKSAYSVGKNGSLEAELNLALRDARPDWIGAAVKDEIKRRSSKEISDSEAERGLGPGGLDLVRMAREGLIFNGNSGSNGFNR